MSTHSRRDFAAISGHSLVRPTLIECITDHVMPLSDTEIYELTQRCFVSLVQISSLNHNFCDIWNSSPSNKGLILARIAKQMHGLLEGSEAALTKYEDASTKEKIYNWHFYLVEKFLVPKSILVLALTKALNDCLDGQESDLGLPRVRSRISIYSPLRPNYRTGAFAPASRKHTIKEADRLFAQALSRAMNPR